jgi:hypothetical protein
MSATGSIAVAGSGYENGVRPVPLLAAAVTAALGVRVARSRHRRFLHPDGRSFTGTLDVSGLPEPIGSALTDRPARHPVTVRVSKGAGTRPGRADVLGIAVRVHGPARGAERDLLVSTVGRGRWSRRLPLPRRGFDSWYGSILAYRTGSGRKVYLSAEPDPDAPPWGRTLESVVARARHDGARLLLSADDRPFGTVTFGNPLSAEADAALAFDPIRNTGPDRHPTGTVHGIRAFAYRAGQRWRGAEPAADDPAQVARAILDR